MTYAYFKGYKAVYDYDRHDWFYEDTGESATKNPRPCKRCGHHSVKDEELEYDYCLGNLGDNVTSACCGHGVKQGFILFEDGRMFIEEKEDKIMIDEKDIKKGIALMYNKMGKECIKISEAIEEDLDKYVITERKIGNELEVADGRKYQLVLELKRLEE